MSQIWQIYVCKHIKKFVGIKKHVVFWAHFHNYSDIFLQNSLQDTIFVIFALKFAFRGKGGVAGPDAPKMQALPKLG